jgi:uncharacterized membrane protein
MMDGTGMMNMMVFMWIAPNRAFCADWDCHMKWLGASKLPFSVNNPENALEILRKRYAKGEISREEFETIKRDIEKSH